MSRRHRARRIVNRGKIGTVPIPGRPRSNAAMNPESPPKLIDGRGPDRIVTALEVWLPPSRQSQFGCSLKRKRVLSAKY